MWVVVLFGMEDDVDLCYILIEVVDVVCVIYSELLVKLEVKFVD